MNEFSSLADPHRQEQTELDLLGRPIQLSTAPCGPLYRSHVSPDRELKALLRTRTTPGDSRRLDAGSNMAASAIPSVWLRHLNPPREAALPPVSTVEGWVF